MDTGLKLEMLMLLLLFGLNTSETSNRCPTIDETYIECGDFNLGALITVYENDREGKCRKGVILHRRMQYVESIAYAVKTVNADSNLMKGFNLGFAVLNDCGGAGSATDTAIKFLPCDQESHCCSQSIPNVVGTIGPLTSAQAIVLSPFLGYHGIAQISPMATSDVLSEKDKYPFFMRTMPPDNFQVKAIIRILLHFGWKYVSLLYENDKYGVANFINFKTGIRNLDICIAHEDGVSDIWNSTAGDYIPIAQALLRNRKAKVIVAFIMPHSVLGVLAALRKLKSDARFTWLGSETFDDRAVQGFEDMVVDSLHLSGQQSFAHEDFPAYFSQLTPANNPDNPWYRQFWKHSFECEWNQEDINCNNDSCSKHCDSYEVNEITNFFNDTVWTYNFIDTVYIFAHAIDRAIHYCQSKLKSPTYEKQDIINCVRGQTLLNELKNTSYDGYTKHVEFDENNDILSVQQIVQQLQKVGDDYVFQSVGYWDRKNDTIILDDDHPLQWGPDHEYDLEYRIYANSWDQILLHSSVIGTIPQSVCSRPCGKGQETVVKEVNPKCCWDCIDCARNEIVNNSRCVQCPQNTWPDLERTSCEDILPYYIHLNDLLGYLLLTLIVVAAIVLVLSTVTFVLFRDQKIIKASTPKLMLVTLLGLYLSLMGCLMFLLEPTEISCTLLFILFHLSFTMLYSPLLARTLRIYRVFSGSARLTTKIAFVRESCMFGLVFTCVSVQGLVMTIALLREPPTPRVSMPDFLKEYVVLYCHTEVSSLLLPLGYNIVLLLCCTILGFLTRKLPENYNESLYIFFSSATTIIVWLAFLPTFFLIHDATYRQLLLPAAALLNVYTMLIGLLFPRVYVVLNARRRSKKLKGRQSHEWTRRSTIMLSITNQSASTEFMTSLRTKEMSRSVSSCDRCTRCNSMVVDRSKSLSNRSLGSMNDVYSTNSEDEVTDTKM